MTRNDEHKREVVVHDSIDGYWKNQRESKEVMYFIRIEKVPLHQLV